VPYLLPTHVQQAFFYKNPNGNPWWQIVHVNSRARQMFDTMSSIALQDIDIATTSTAHTEEDEEHHIGHANPIQDGIATTSTLDVKGDAEGDEEDITGVDEDLPKFEIEQISKTVASNIVQLPLGLDLDLTEEELQEARAENDEALGNQSFYYTIAWIV